MAKRIFILDQGLQHAIGHHPNMNRALNKEIGRRGLSPIHIVNRNCSDWVLNGMAAAKVFRQSAYEQLSTDPISGPMETFFLQSAILEEDLSALKPDTFTHEDIVLLVVAMPSVLFGYLRWWGALDPARRPRTVALLPMYAGIQSLEPLAIFNHHFYRAMAQLYRFVGNQIDGVDLVGMTLLAGSDTMAADYTFLLKRPVASYPSQLSIDPAIVDPLAEAFEKSDEAPIIGYYGDGRADKGYALLPDIVARLLAGHPTAKIRIQANKAVAGNPMNAVMDRLAEIAVGEPRLSLIDHFMTDEQFHEQLAQTDIILQPYDLLPYARVPSGVFMDITAIGRASVVPAGTSMAKDIESLGGFGGIAPDREPRMMADAALALLARVSDLRAAAPSIRAEWRKRHGTPQLVDRVLQAAAS